MLYPRREKENCGCGCCGSCKGCGSACFLLGVSHSWTTWSGRANPASGWPFSCVSIPFYNMREQDIGDQLNLKGSQSIFIYSLYN